MKRVRTERGGIRRRRHRAKRIVVALVLLGTDGVKQPCEGAFCLTVR